MNTQEFIKRIKDTESVDIHDIKKMILDSIEHSGSPKGFRNLIIAIEEMAELIKELTKKLRGKENIIDILQELSHVQLTIYYLQEIFEIDDELLQAAMTVTMNHVTSTIAQEGEYK